jgi:hypothetical protein
MAEEEEEVQIEVPVAMWVSAIIRRVPGAY